MHLISDILILIEIYKLLNFYAFVIDDNVEIVLCIVIDDNVEIVNS